MSDPLEQLVEPARAALAGTVPTPAASDEPDQFAGEAADGRVRAVVSSDGHVLALRVDPALLRAPLEDVAEEVRAAINAALAARPGQADLSPLVAMLTRAREQARREMAIVTTGFRDVEAGVRAVRAAQRSEGVR